MIICFSGVDGCGKGTQKQLLANYLRKKNINVFLSKAYGDAEKESFSAFISRWSQESILFLFQAFHIEQRNEAELALLRGEVVIADRWDESYLAYHRKYGILAKDRPLRIRLNEIAFRGIVPDLTFFIDTPIDVARKRIEHRGADFFDRLPEEYHRTMRTEYLHIAQERNWNLLDGTQSVEQIHLEVIAILEKIYPDFYKKWR